MGGMGTAPWAAATAASAARGGHGVRGAHGASRRGRGGSAHCSHGGGARRCGCRGLRGGGSKDGSRTTRAGAAGLHVGGTADLGDNRVEEEGAVAGNHAPGVADLGAPEEAPATPDAAQGAGAVGQRQLALDAYTEQKVLSRSSYTRKQV
ncbi:spidroin-1-like [Panicum virgatum]|uniref:spidroin-1-like n=1 Tax=Panicum virgatum TaxID=38727 RepID=UPI0019D6569C|nr:spidroin-1-like [Panicum virgatum]